MNLQYHQHLTKIAERDVAAVITRDTGYGGSWRNAGGVGAWENLRRKWDRIAQALNHSTARERAEQIIDERKTDLTIAEVIRILNDVLYHDDIFAALRNDQRPEGIIADLRDLRRYLLLLEAHALEEQWVSSEEPKED